jgi:SAM-dependent methyltransferase
MRDHTADDYGDIFNLRGLYYQRAMEHFPDVRVHEFLNVIREARVANGMTVVDIPSGGGYLSRHLDDAIVFGLESSSAFAQLAAARGERVALYDGNRFPLADSCADRVLSIAGLHHVEDKRQVFSEMRRIAAEDGLVVVADVAEDSYVRRFLDDFVGRYCLTGHSGWYFGDATRVELEDAGLRIVRSALLDYPWCAASVRQLAEFCRLLFGMVDADNGTVARGIRDYLGAEESNGVSRLNWQLHCFVCAPSP